IVVGAPPVAVVGIVRRLSREHSYRTNAALHSRQDLDGRHHPRLPPFPGELEVQNPVFIRLQSGKHLHVGHAAGSGISHYVEMTEQSLPIRLDGHEPAAFAARTGSIRAVDGLSEMKTHFIDATLQRDVI